MSLNMGAKIRPVFNKPLHAMLKPRESVDQLRVQGFYGEERDQTDERSDLERKGLPVRKMQHVIEKSIFPVPELDFFATDVVHGPADVHEVLEELAGHVFVRAIVA